MKTEMGNETDLYGGTDLEEQIHPYAIMGDFVRNYYELIKPAFEKGNIDNAVAGVIEDACLNAQDAKLGSFKLREGSDVPYKISLLILKAMLDNRAELNNNKRALEGTLRNVNLQVSQLDLALQGDGVYDKHRRKEVA